MAHTNPNPDSPLLQTLRAQRHLQGLSQSELGALLKMPQSHIARIETGTADVRLSTLTQIARALDLEPMLIPKHLVPAVRNMIDPQQQSQSDQPKLVGNAPEDSQLVPEDETSATRFSF